MSNYTSNKAKKRDNPTAPKASEYAKASGQTASNKQSNAERSTTQSSKFRTVTPKLNQDVQPTYTAKSGYNEGNFIRLQANTKGTNVVGRPAGVALASKRKVYAASANPSGADAQTTAKYD